jgi:hypothetical protein
LARVTSKNSDTDSSEIVSEVDPFLSIAEDKTLESLSLALSSSKFKISDTLADEVKSYSISEDMLKNCFGSSQDIEAITQALKNVVIYRHRVSQIYTMLLDLYHDLDEIGSSVQTYLYRKYSVYRNLKNEIQRKAAVESAVPLFSKIHSKVSKLLEITKYIDEKLDKNEFTLRAILQSSERLWYSKEGIKHAK